MLTRKKNILISCATIFLLLFETKSFSSDIGNDQVVENKEYIVRVISHEKFGIEGGNVKFRFEVKNLVNKKESFVEMSNLTTQIKRMEIVNELMIVFGELRNIADVVTILDLNAAIERDSILCYGPMLSTEKRYIVYKKFYPRFADPPATSNVLLIYDLLKQPADNRLDQKRKNIGPDLIGIPIYPEDNLKNRSYSVWIEDPSKRHTVYPPGGKYLWTNDDKKLIFVDKYDGDNWLVAIDLSKGLNQINIRKSAIDISKIIAIDVNDKGYNTKLEKIREGIIVTDLLEAREDKVRITLSSDPMLKANQVEMELPK